MIQMLASRVAPEKTDFLPVLMPVLSKRASTGDTYMANDFWAQYKHPNWQKKRLEALDDAGWACQECETKNDQLHVHHVRYIKGRKIWEYELHEFRVLCEACHAQEHIYKEAIGDLLTIANRYQIPSGEIASLLFGYISRMGPADLEPMSKISEVIIYECGLFSGEIAGELSKRLNPPELEAWKASIYKALELNENGESVQASESAHG